MSKVIVVLKVLGIILAILIVAWVVVIFGVAMLSEWAGDMKRKVVDTHPIK